MTISNIHQKNLPHKNILKPIMCSLKLSLLSFALSSESAFAGAGTNVYACVYLNEVDGPENFTFTTKGLGCMNAIGNSPVPLTVTKAGVSCASIGYIEQKDTDTGGDNCYARNSGIWELAYSGGDANNSGTVQIQLYNYLTTYNYMDIQPANTSKNVNLCVLPNLCPSTTMKWDRGTVGEAYIIFQPAANNSSTSDKANANVEQCD